MSRLQWRRFSSRQRSFTHWRWKYLLLYFVRLSIVICYRIPPNIIIIMSKNNTECWAPCRFKIYFESLFSMKKYCKHPQNAITTNGHLNIQKLTLMHKGQRVKRWSQRLNTMSLSSSQPPRRFVAFLTSCGTVESMLCGKVCWPYLFFSGWFLSNWFIRIQSTFVSFEK